MRLPLLAALLCLLLPVAGPVATAGHSGTGPATVPAAPPAPPQVDDLQTVSSPAIAPAGGPPPATNPTAEPLALAQSDGGIDPANTTMTVQLRANGDARWTVTTVFVLRDDNDTSAFDRLASQFRSGDASSGYNLTVFESAAERAAPEREMAIRNASFDSETVPRGNVTVGRLSMSFTWANFSRVEGDRLIVGDAFNTSAGNGTWLPGLTADQRLVIVGPEGFGALDSPPDAGVQEGRKFTWEGRTEFEPGYLTVVYERTVPRTSPGPTPDEDPLLGWFLMSAGLLGVGLLAGVAYLWTRRETRDGVPSGGAADDDEPPAPPAAAGAVATNDEETTGDDPASDVDLDLLSDEERVEYLLQQNGGRMKQANIVKETGWSNAKVSQLLSEMADAERVNKLRIGRENLISLPEEDVAEFDEQ
jgi:hypothetical protein